MSFFFTTRIYYIGALGPYMSLIVVEEIGRQETQYQRPDRAKELITSVFL